jgi:FkbM family methyltransferase
MINIVTVPAAENPVMSLLSPAASNLPSIAYQLPYWEQTAVPILRGPLFGSRWVLASGGKIMRLLCGTYKPALTRLFQELVKPESVVFDLGAQAGYYTLLSSRLARRGQVVAFETDPRHLAFLRANLAANRCNNVQVRELAVSAHAEWDHIDDGRFDAKTTTLDDVVDLTRLQPTHLRIDVRADAFETLKGGLETIVAARPTIFLTVHQTDVRADCCDLLRDLDYELKPIEGHEFRLANSLLCVG